MHLAKSSESEEKQVLKHGWTPQIEIQSPDEKHMNLKITSADKHQICVKSLAIKSQ